MRHILRFASALGLVGFLSFPGQAAVTFYTSQVAFDAAATTGLIEDFEATGATTDTAISGFSHNGVTYQGLAGGVPFANVYLYSPGGSEFGAGVPQPLTTTVLTGRSGRARKPIWAVAIIWTRRKSSLLNLMAEMARGAKISSLGEP